MNPKLVLGLGVVALLLVSNAFVGYKAYNLGQDVKQADWDAAELKRAQAEREANDKIIKQRPKVKHENKNRDLDASRAYGCKRGWVRELDKCATLR